MHRIPQALHVTSNLDSKIQRADYCQGGGGTRSHHEKGHKFFVIKILTSKYYWFKILQSIFANRAPVKAFRGGGEGGVPPECGFFPKRNRVETPI